MNLTPVLLWSDALLFLLIAVCIWYAFLAARHAHLRAPWVKVRRNAVGLAAATVLACFALIGLLDSVHFRPYLEGRPGAAPQLSVDVRSVLDVLLARGLGNMTGKSEKTYSAPLATQAFSREAVELPDGRQAREFPRLANGGRHLQDPAKDWAGDVTMRTLGGLAGGALAWLLVAVLLLALARGRSSRDRPGFAAFWRDAWTGRSETPWRAVLLALLGVFLCAGIALALGSRYHLLGTDKVGLDVLTLSLKSIRTALLLGTLTTLVMLPLGVLLGIAAGYFKGWVDDLIQYVYITLNSIPGVLLIAASVLMMQVYVDTHPQLFQTAVERADFRLLALCFILGVTSWTGLCRLLRGETLKLREMEYVQAARAFGISHLRIIVRHLLPNTMHLVIITAVMDFSAMVLTEAVLSYVGVGVDPNTTSFGSMINAARLEMSRDPMVWWSLAASFFFMFSLVLAANLFADAVRDAFDPRLVVRRARWRLPRRAAS